MQTPTPRPRKLDKMLPWPQILEKLPDFNFSSGIHSKEWFFIHKPKSNLLNSLKFPSSLYIRFLRFSHSTCKRVMNVELSICLISAFFRDQQYRSDRRWSTGGRRVGYLDGMAKPQEAREIFDFFSKSIDHS